MGQELARALACRRLALGGRGEAQAARLRITLLRVSSWTAFPALLNYPHAVQALDSGETYTNDANGNMTERVVGGQTYTQTFDAENRLVAFSRGRRRLRPVPPFS